MSTLAAIGFTIWGIYKGVWVLRKVWKWCAQKLTERRTEQEYLGALAWQIKLDRGGR